MISDNLLILTQFLSINVSTNARVYAREHRGIIGAWQIHAWAFFSRSIRSTCCLIYIRPHAHPFGTLKCFSPVLSI